MFDRCRCLCAVSLEVLVSDDFGELPIILFAMTKITEYQRIPEGR